MKKIILACLILISMLLLTACNQQQRVRFSETEFESEFTLPAGLRYVAREKNSKGYNGFAFYDGKNTEVGGISFFGEKFDGSIETSFDDCWRAWNIGASEMNSGNKNGIVTQNSSTFELDHYIYVANDAITSIVAESCKGRTAFIYWVPGVMITNHGDLLEYYGKRPVRVLGIYNTDTNISDDDFIEIVHDIAKSVTIKSSQS